MANWLVGGAGYFLYQAYRSEIRQVETASGFEEDAGYWAEKILSGDGAYILYFRHAEREDWPLVVTYDYFEVTESVDGRQQTYAKAVCPSERGIEDARIIGKTFKTLGVSVKRVLSSPSCRARETANLAFGRLDEASIVFLHTTAIPASQHEEFGQLLREVLLRNSPHNGDRTIVVGHGKTLDSHASILFPAFDGELTAVEQSGFYLIEVKNGDMVPRWTFSSFTDFSRLVLHY